MQCFWINQDAYVKYLVENGTEQAYMDTMIANAHIWVLPAMIVGNLICSFISGKFGQHLLRKHFEKAGVV